MSVFPDGVVPGAGSAGLNPPSTSLSSSEPPEARTGPSSPEARDPVRPSAQVEASGSLRRPMPPLRATYRLQLHAGFPLAAALGIVPYLERLGVSHIYASPVLQSQPGSQHGYDVTDPARLDEERGDESDWRRLTDALHDRAMGLMLDIVPNHMSASPQNPYWSDVLRHGRSSAYAGWFDIDWHDPDTELRGHVLLPVLGMPLGEAIARRELGLVFDGGEPKVSYHDHRFPLDPRTAAQPLSYGLDEALGTATGAERLALESYRTVVRELARLPTRTEGDALTHSRRVEDARALMTELNALVGGEPAVAAQVARALDRFVAGEGGPARFRRLLDRQPYRLAFWRRAAAEINYRRFFSINELVALNMEDAPVFNETHQLVLHWVASGRVDALRIDHVDGLRDPAAYLRRLRSAVDERRPPSATGSRLPILVEKILARGESLRADWPVEGTTGYEILNDLEAVFIDPDGCERIESRYRKMTGLDRRGVGFHDMALTGKRRMLRGALAADVERLARLFRPIARRDPRTEKVSHAALVTAIVEVMVRLPVYRTYVEATMGGDTVRAPATSSDIALVEDAVALAASRRGVQLPVLGLLREVLLLRDLAQLAPVERRDRNRFVSRFQQISGPAAAKGVEDTALYLYFPLASRNEVGSDPERPLASALTDLHRANAARARQWPRNMVCVSTHDTKRGADTRSRLDVLSEMPDVWWAAVRRWRRLNARFRRRTGRREAPDANSEYLLYQTLVGIWPAETAGSGGSVSEDALTSLRPRVVDYMRKAVREGQSRSSWLLPDLPFEEALEGFVTALLDPERSPQFLAELNELAGRMAPAGWRNALARTLLHLTVPGEPDIYQGDEIWQFTLVDPDNRRPVDYSHRAALLDGIMSGWESTPREDRPRWVRGLLDAAADGRVKLHLIWRALDARRRSAVFSGGGYLPLEVTGDRESRLLAFARTTSHDHGRKPYSEPLSAALVVVPRFTFACPDTEESMMEGMWGDCELVVPSWLDATRWRCVLTDRLHEGVGRLRVADMLRDLPGALLLPDALP